MLILAGIPENAELAEIFWCYFQLL